MVFVVKRTISKPISDHSQSDIFQIFLYPIIAVLSLSALVLA